jgi:hypothetical protein
MEANSAARGARAAEDPEVLGCRDMSPTRAKEALSRRLTTPPHRPALAAALILGTLACSGMGSRNTVIELAPGRTCAGSTTETEGSISRTHFWTVELTKTDAVFTFDDRRVVLQDVVGTKPVVCRGNQQTGKVPDVVLELEGGRVARWKGTTIDVDGKLYDISAPGTFTIAPDGSMTRRG